MLPTSRIEVSKSALENNLRFLKEQMGPDACISSVVKGNAYGHAIEQFVPLAEACGMNHFSVFDASEAYRVKQVAGNPETEVLIMGMISNDQMEWAVENDVAFFTFEPERLEEALSAARRVRRPAKVHIELETGMNRTGFSRYQLPEVVHLLKKHPGGLLFEGLCTHFAGAESIANYVRIKNQRKAFNHLYKWFKNQGLAPRLRHTACSAAAMRYPPTRMDMVRIGIMQYGFWPSRETFIDFSIRSGIKEDPLERLVTWKSSVMDIKRVKAGEYVGYGTSYLANEAMEIATVPVGYAHGFSRSLSNQGRVLIRGKRVGVIGMVNMNMITVDVSQLDSVERGDEVVIIGRQGERELSVSSFGEFSEQVNYELLTRLPMDIPRKVVE
ncbi:MAG: alanine racemase [Phaeodactylibacter sp.]|nr:alanine racemase [Phaeodactylibacter sp.]